MFPSFHVSWKSSHWVPWIATIDPTLRDPDENIPTQNSNNLSQEKASERYSNSSLKFCNEDMLLPAAIYCSW